jgi:ATP-dependent DNA helicase RecQ
LNQPKEVLKKYWGFDSFRPMQEDIIQSILDGKDTLALLPTGGGKSMCFQIPGIVIEGICIVISPLIALMKDQVENLVKKGIKAKMINSSMKYAEIDITLDNCVYGDIKFLYVSPERLLSDMFIERVKKMKVSFIAVDEAHCISQWGYDFRPSYLEIAQIRLLLPSKPVIALTATATTDVIQDIQEKLVFKNQSVFKQSFSRKNLAYMAYKEDDKNKKMLKIFIKTKGSAIVYLRSRKNTVSIANFLKNNNISALPYHAGMSNIERNKTQQSWIDNKTRVIVATNAFGMGIDKPDVKVVVHLDLPESPEAYFQEAGRAGRDEKKAFAVLLFNEKDEEELQFRTLNSFPALEKIRLIYQSLANFYQLAAGSGKDVSFDFEIEEFAERYKLNKVLIYNCLKILEDNCFIILSESIFQPSRIIFKMNGEALYNFQISYPAYEPLIKLILRAYGGVFDNIINIDENFISKKLKTEFPIVIKQLKALHQLRVLEYFAKSTTPTITYLTERKDSEKLQIDMVKFNLKKKNAINKTNAIIGFINTKVTCRSVFLLDYFNEKNITPCGICDVCLKNKNEENLRLHFKKIESKINSALQNASLALSDLVKQVGEDEKYILQVLRLMLDNNQISFSQMNKYCLTI